MFKRNQISYRKPDPPFLRRIREKIGYQEITDVDTKKQELDRDNNLEDQDDEKPTVLIIENSNASKEEQEDYAEKLNEAKPAKILFKKPVKKDEKAGQKSTNRVETAREEKGQTRAKSDLKRFVEDGRTTEKDNSKRHKQNEKSGRLLSFGNDEEEEF